MLNTKSTLKIWKLNPTKNWTLLFGKHFSFLYWAQFTSFVVTPEVKFKRWQFNSFSVFWWNMENFSNMSSGKWYCKVFSDLLLKKLLMPLNQNQWRKRNFKTGWDFHSNFCFPQLTHWLNNILGILECFYMMCWKFMRHAF